MAMSDEAHPDGCMCEDCKHMRARRDRKRDFPEWQRQLNHIRGQDSEPDPVLSRIPEGMTERDARARGLIP
jgi:hypothetical protein